MGAKRAVVVFSGGIDSSALLYKIYKKGFDTRALTFLYGQKHKKEVQAARNVCDGLGVLHKVVDVSVIRELLQGSALTDSAVDIPSVPETTQHYETLKATIVPNRNAILLSLAVGYAVSIGANSVFFGAHFSDRGVYPDCRKEFVRAFEYSERLATDNPSLVIDAPFVDIDKSEIVKLGIELGVPLEATWTCYRGAGVHCGICSSCRERKRAFQQSGYPDLTEYER